MKVRPYQGVMPQLGKNVYIDDTALVIGKVTIGDDSSVWPFAVVRGDVNVITIGEKTLEPLCTRYRWLSSCLAFICRRIDV
jgi:carbonic anhydrase/acetyltransferase-like protein (isoleucine patch superfamily)